MQSTVLAPDTQPEEAAPAAEDVAASAEGVAAAPTYMLQKLNKKLL